MEALSVLEADQKSRLRFQNELDIRINDAQRNLTSQHAQSLFFHLRQARLENERLLKEVETNLFEAFQKLATKAEMIPLTSNMIQANWQTNPNKEPTDKLILHSILNHARLNPTEIKVFLSGNTNDFGKREVQDILGEVGINYYFASTQAFLSWLENQLS
ncbi:hypothetical protein WA1_41420 [Scytonema hofmannii PCC 7110]|uniref:DUF4935 domain-containing protein n=2 Tax=Scytonema hofmannii TaxID=34078 RepID=A0A139WUV5_9CYAN|nr:hypothetical protein WA1_41420 [Scytonema hofmannii PCC 7110]